MKEVQGGERERQGKQGGYRCHLLVEEAKGTYETTTCSKGGCGLGWVGSSWVGLGVLTFLVLFYFLCYRDSRLSKSIFKVGQKSQDNTRRWSRECRVGSEYGSDERIEMMVPGRWISEGWPSESQESVETR